MKRNIGLERTFRDRIRFGDTPKPAQALRVIHLRHSGIRMFIPKNFASEVKQLSIMLSGLTNTT